MTFQVSTAVIDDCDPVPISCSERHRSQRQQADSNTDSVPGVQSLIICSRGVRACLTMFAASPLHIQLLHLYIWLRLCLMVQDTFPLPGRSRSNCNSNTTQLGLHFDLQTTVSMADVPLAACRCCRKTEVKSGLISRSVVCWAVWWRQRMSVAPLHNQ